MGKQFVSKVHKPPTAKENSLFSFPGDEADEFTLKTCDRAMTSVWKWLVSPSRRRLYERASRLAVVLPKTVDFPSPSATVRSPSASARNPKPQPRRL